MELKENIDKLAKAQLDISTLVEKLFTLRHNTSNPLEVQLALRCGVQDEVVTSRMFLRTMPTEPHK